MQQVLDIMSREVEGCQPNDSIFTVASKMKEEGVGAIPVCENNRLVGIITDRDITVRGVADKHAGSDPVRDIMTEDICTIHPENAVSDLEALFAEAQIRRVPVVKEDELVGMVTLGDLAVKHGRDDHAGHTLKEISNEKKL